MADNELAALIPDPKPSWLIRAMDPESPLHPVEGAAHTESFYNEDLGGEVLVPRVRINDKGQPVVVEDPYGKALDLGDYILVPGPPGDETASRATALSKYISNVLIGGSRGSFVDKPLYEEAF
jgi:hypothetical protein